MRFTDCTESVKQKIVVIKENRSELRVKNPNLLDLNKVKVDGCLITDNRSRCDFILEIPKGNRALYIELKGCDIDKAIKQLKATLTLTKDQYLNHHKECYAITTRIPKQGTSTQRKKKEFFRATQTNLVIKNLRSEIAI